MKTIMLAGMIGLFATGAFAHSPLIGTTPANEAVIEAAPQEVLLNFQGGIRLTRVSRTHADHPSVQLDLSGHNGFISEYVLALEPMGSGAYVIEWRGLGDDGHAMNGTFGFMVK